MTVAGDRRGRLLVFATKRAVEQAAQLGIGCVENAVEQAIRAGRKRHQLPPGLCPLGRNERCVLLMDGTPVVVARTAAPLTGRKAWKVLRLIPRRLPRCEIEPDEGSRDDCSGQEAT